MSGFDCAKVRDRCGGECCGPCPIPAATWETHRDNVQGELAHALDDGVGFIHAMTVAGDCAFKQVDGLCAIYPGAGELDGRAEVCRRMGDESHLMLTCRWMDKDGRVRSRAERREISRVLAKEQRRILVGLRERSGRATCAVRQRQEAMADGAEGTDVERGDDDKA